MTKTIAKKKVLIVDDDPDIRKTFGMLLSRHGYEVMEASYALPALFRVTGGSPDLILADINMPKMNGFDLLKQLKGHLDTQNIPVVVITGAASEENRQAAFAAGCAGYMTKPIEAKVFLAQIDKLLHGGERTNP